VEHHLPAGCGFGAGSVRSRSSAIGRLVLDCSSPTGQKKIRLQTESHQKMIFIQKMLNSVAREVFYSKNSQEFFFVSGTTKLQIY